MSDDFLPKPTLTQAMMASPFRTLLLFGGVWFAGAFVGKKASVAGLKKGGQLLGTAAGAAGRGVKGLVNTATAKEGSTAAHSHQLMMNGSFNQEHGSCMRCGSANHYTGQCG